MIHGVEERKQSIYLMLRFRNEREGHTLSTLMYEGGRDRDCGLLVPTEGNWQVLLSFYLNQLS